MTPRTMILISAVVFMAMLAIVLIKPAPNVSPISFSPFDKKRAYFDIEHGTVKLFSFGIVGPSTDMNKVAAKYGFQYVGAGCEIGYTPDQKEYIDLVRDYLTHRNGNGWEERYHQELEAIRGR